MIGGNYNASYLPVHLFSINIVLIVIHYFKPSKLLENYLYSFGIIPVAAALIFPATCSVLSPLNFMVIHSFFVHALLLAYPLMLLAAGELRRDPYKFPCCLLLLWGYPILIAPLFLILYAPMLRHTNWHRRSGKMISDNL